MKRVKGWLIAAALAVVLLISILCAERERQAIADGILLHVIDVGQADCLVIETPEGNVMIDTGTDISESIVRAYLRSNGLTDFTYLILTHPHDDHIGNADMILREFPVEHVLCADSTSEETVWKNVQTAMEEKSRTEGTEWIRPVSGAVYWTGELRLEVLMAPEEGNGGGNNDSLILRAEYGDCSMLFMGDAEAEAEARLLTEVSADKLCADLLKVGHHGSSGSTTESFLQAVAPRLAVISAGSGNSFSHPHEELLQRLRTVGADIYRTDLHGSLIFYCDGKDFTLR